jgi:hypothetical protein
MGACLYLFVQREKAPLKDFHNGAYDCVYLTCLAYSSS